MTETPWDWKPLITQWQKDFVIARYKETMHFDVAKYLEDNFDTYYTPERFDILMNANDRLGSKNIAGRDNNRVAADQDLSWLRDRKGLKADQVLVDETLYHTAQYFCWCHGGTAQEWMEHRSVCRRDLFSCLSAQWCSGICEPN